MREYQLQIPCLFDVAEESVVGSCKITRIKAKIEKIKNLDSTMLIVKNPQGA